MGILQKKTPKCKHIAAYKTSFGITYCPNCERNIESTTDK